MSTCLKGRIYLADMACRRPPQIAPNWRTTSRLKASGLAAIVKVSEKDAPLRMTDPIVWGEIGIHDQQRDEFRRRQVCMRTLIIQFG